jgi:hypothetical protein
LRGDEIAGEETETAPAFLHCRIVGRKTMSDRKPEPTPDQAGGMLFLTFPQSALVVTIGMARATCAHFRQAIAADFVVDLIRFAKPDTVRKPVRKPQPRSRHAEENQSGRGINSGSGQLHAIRRIGAVLVAFAHERPDRF